MRSVAKRPRLPLWAFAVAALVAAPLAPAQQAPAATPQASSADELAAKATDPTAALMSFQLNDWYTASLHDADGSVNQVVFRAAIPFAVAGTQNIFRVTQPWVTSTPTGVTGLGDTTIFELVVFGASWGRWGVGVSATFPTGHEGLSLDKWTVGPSAGFVNSSDKRYNWGLFVQTFFSYAGKDSADSVGLINVQPIFSYQLGHGRSLSLGNSAFVYDTKKGAWSSLQLGVNYGQVVGLWGHKWRPNAEVDYDFQNNQGNPKWTIRAGIVLLLPVG